MATVTDLRSVQATLTTTTVDDACLTQFWDRVEVQNQDGTNALYITFDGTVPTVGGEGTYLVRVSQSRIFTTGIKNSAGIAGNTTPATACHRVKVLGNGGLYAVEGVGRN